jgi:hypothetical protein
VDPSIDRAPSAESSALACLLVDRLRANTRDPSLARVANKLRATVGLVDFDTGDLVTVRFDLGRIVVHAGPVGVPTVTFAGPLAALLGIAALPLGPRTHASVATEPATEAPPSSRGDHGSIPPPSRPGSRRSVFPPEVTPLDPRALARAAWTRDLRVYGALAHPRTVARFIRLVGTPR